MNLFLRSVGFKGYTAEEEDSLVRRVISAGIKSDKLFRNDKHGKAMIVYATSVSAGIAVYGHMSKARFVYDTHFPYLSSNRSVNEKEIVVFKNLTSESFCAISEGDREVPRMFFITNPLDVLFDIDHQNQEGESDYETEGDGALRHMMLKDVNVSYSGMAIAASVLLAAYDKKKFFKEPADSGLQFTNRIKKEEKPAVSNAKRAEKEDVLSIVDTHIYPGGNSGDSFVVLGNIVGLREEENMITGQTFYIMTLQANNETLDVAVNKTDVIGEPRVGRRFNARMWLHGYVR